MRGLPCGEPSHDRVYSRFRDRACGAILLPLAPHAGAWSGSVKLVGPFVVVMPGTTRAPNEAATALQRPRPTSPPLPRRRAGSYSGHTPGLRRLNHGADQAPHREPSGGRSPSQVSDGLFRSGHVARRRYPPGLTPCGASPLAPQFPALGRISGGRTWKRPLTHRRQILRGSAPSPARITHKPFGSGLSWLSYSRPSTFEGPRPGQGRFRRSPGEKLPT